MTLSLRFAATSDVGRVRRDNQDSGYVGHHVIAVADGVGGAARGDIASSSTIDVLRKLDVPPGDEALGTIAATIHLAHDRLADIVDEHAELDGTSTTLTAAIFDGHQLNVGHVGDSRGYVLRDGDLQQITSDHSLVQSLVDEGRITEAEARVHPHRNLILKAIDSVHDPEPDVFAVPVQAGDRILFCSDGCSGVLEASTMAELMQGEDLAAISAGLVLAALEAGSSDNVTVVVAEVYDGAPTEAEPIVVGAASVAPHLQIPETETETGLQSEVEFDDFQPVELDPETIRYAPLPPPRRAWLRRLLVGIVVLALLGGAGYGVFLYGQSQYFLKSDKDTKKISLYRGFDASLPGVKFFKFEGDTGYTEDDLQEGFANDLKTEHPNVDGMADAREKLYANCLEALDDAKKNADPPAPFGIGQAPSTIAEPRLPNCVKAE